MAGGTATHLCVACPALLAVAPPRSPTVHVYSVRADHDATAGSLHHVGTVALPCAPLAVRFTAERHQTEGPVLLAALPSAPFLLAVHARAVGDDGALQAAADAAAATSGDAAAAAGHPVDVHISPQSPLRSRRPSAGVSLASAPLDEGDPAFAPVQSCAMTLGKLGACGATRRSLAVRSHSERLGGTVTEHGAEEHEADAGQARPYRDAKRRRMEGEEAEAEDDNN